MSDLVRLFKNLKPHIVHTFDTKPGVWGCLAARIAGIPIVIGTVTGLGSLYAGDGTRTRVVRAAYQLLQSLASRWSDRTIFQNRDDADQFVKAGVVPPRKAMVIPGSGVSTDTFSPDRFSSEDRGRLRAEFDFRSADMVVTMVSRVIRSKGVVEFAAAAREVRRQYPHARFLLVGADDIESVDRLNNKELSELKQVVTWIGPRGDIPAILAASDVFVLPSAYREGIPRVLLEAASMGLPIVTTDSPGCNDVVDDGINGYLVPLRDSATLGDAIARLVLRPELRHRFGQISRTRAIDQFDLKVVVQQTRSIYRQLLAEKM